MSLEKDFFAKIDAEHEEFVKKIESMDKADIINNLWNLARFHTMYNFIKDWHQLDERHYAHLIKLDNPISTICRVHARISATTEEVHEGYFEVIVDVTDNTLFSADASYSVNELLAAMYDAIELEITAGNNAEQQKKAFKIFLDEAYYISDEDAEVLLQFKNPMEIIMQVSQYDKYSLDNIKDAVEYVNSHDVYAMQFELNHEKVTNDTKCRHETIEQILHIIPNPSFNTTMGWLNYFKNFNIQQGEKSIETDNMYADFISILERIKGEFGPEVLQQIYDFGADSDIKHWDICEDSLYSIAEYLEDGRDIGEISDLAGSGAFLQPYADLKEQLERGDTIGMSLN